jgi:hypothetical protein
MKWALVRTTNKSISNLPLMLAMDEDTATLVADALDVINPEAQKAEDAARALALAIQQELK